MNDFGHRPMRHQILVANKLLRLPPKPGDHLIHHVPSNFFKRIFSHDTVAVLAIALNCSGCPIRKFS